MSMTNERKLIVLTAIVMSFIMIAVIGYSGRLYVLYLMHQHINQAAERPTEIAVFVNELSPKAEVKYLRLLEPTEVFLPDHTHLLIIDTHSVTVHEYSTDEAAQDRVARLSRNGSTLKLLPAQVIFWGRSTLELPPANRQVYLFKNFLIFYHDEDEQAKHLLTSLLGEPVAGTDLENE